MAPVMISSGAVRSVRRGAKRVAFVYVWLVFSGLLHDFRSDWGSGDKNGPRSVTPMAFPRSKCAIETFERGNTK